MKKNKITIHFLAILIIIQLLLTNIMALPGPTEIVPDDNLEAAIRARLTADGNGIPAEQSLSPTDIAKLTTLDAHDTTQTSKDQDADATDDISDLSGLEYATELDALMLKNNNISNLAPLEDLTTLTYLDLENNKISDITSLASLTNLDMLRLGFNDVSDLIPLKNLTKLTYLDMDANNISDISPLAYLVNLEDLYMWNNQISDVTPLAELTKLTKLAVSKNLLTDITPLAGLTNLGSLYLDENYISNVTPLAGLTNLETLYLHTNQISDISSLNPLFIDANPIDQFYVYNQTVTLPTQKTIHGNITVANPVKAYNSTVVMPSTLTPVSGTYSVITNTVSWSNLPASGRAEFEFKDENFNGHANWDFSGKVVQPYSIYTVNYDGNANTSGTAPSSETVAEGTSVTVKAKGDLEKTGYTFTGWNTRADGSGTDYVANSSFIMPANSVTLYAQWSSIIPDLITSPQTGANPPVSYAILGRFSFAFAVIILMRKRSNKENNKIK